MPRSLIKRQQLLLGIREGKKLNQNPGVLNLSSANVNNQDIDLVQFLRELTSILEIKTGIQELILDANNITDEDAAILSDFLKQHNTLTKLSLRNNRLGPNGSNHLGAVLETNKTLMELRLDGNQIGASNTSEQVTPINTSKDNAIEAPPQQQTALVSLGISLTLNIKLQVLQLNDTGLNYLDINRLIVGLNANRKLQELFLRNNNIGDNGVCALSESLLKNTHSAITRLFLTYNNITDIGATALSHLLRQNKTLQVITLTSNFITDVGAKQLSDALENNYSLIFLSLNNNKIQDASIRAKIDGYLKRNKELAEELYKAIVTEADLDNLKKLIAAKANLRWANSDGNTPLHQAVLTKNVQLINFLIITMLENNISLTQRNKEGKTAEDLSGNLSYLWHTRKISKEKISFMTTQMAKLIGQTTIEPPSEDATLPEPPSPFMGRRNTT